MLERYILNEVLTPRVANCKVILEESQDPSKPKKMYMEGIFIQAEVRNLNGRIYPLAEIRNAVEDVNERLARGEPILAECDHPENRIETSLEHVAGSIEKMWMDANNGMGKMLILPTPKGNIIRTLLSNGINLGCSSRGTGQLDANGYVSDFQMQTVDIVHSPSAADAVPKVVLESMNHKRYGKEITKLATAMTEDQKAQKYLMNELNSWLSEI